MRFRQRSWELGVLLSFALAACGGGSGGSSSTGSGDADGPDPTDTGTVTVALTDGPAHHVDELVLHLTHLELGHANGQTTRLELAHGPASVDMLQLQNGAVHELIDDVPVAAGDYRWMELGIDLERSHVRTAAGGHHGMSFGVPNALRVEQHFAIHAAEHAEFVLDFDLRFGLRERGRGGMMGTRYELHHGLRLMPIDEAGGIVGAVDPALVDVNHVDCDPAPGGNWVYLFEGGAGEADDFAETETDGRTGPLATARVELHHGIGEYRYHLAFVPAGTYRVAFTCSGEWDEPGDDDYPADPDGRFDFQALSPAVTVAAGEVQILDLAP